MKKKKKGDDIKDSHEWTKQEMTVHKDGYTALVAAIIKQWHKDGEPAGDKTDIDLWSNILEAALRRKEN